MAGLPAAGLDRLTPAQGAFYIYADVSHLTNDSRDFCKRMLAEAGVATTPGVDFDRARGAGTLRISFAGSTAEMEEAVRRLKTVEAGVMPLRSSIRRGNRVALVGSRRSAAELRLRQGVHRRRARDLRHAKLAQADREMAAVYGALSGSSSPARPRIIWPRTSCAGSPTARRPAPAARRTSPAA